MKLMLSSKQFFILQTWCFLLTWYFWLNSKYFLICFAPTLQCHIHTINQDFKYHHWLEVNSSRYCCIFQMLSYQTYWEFWKVLKIFLLVQFSKCGLPLISPISSFVSSHIRPNFAEKPLWVSSSFKPSRSYSLLSIDLARYCGITNMELRGGVKK